MFRRHPILGPAALAIALICAAPACSNDKADIATKDPKAAMAAASTRTVGAKTVKLALSAKTQTGIAVLAGSGAYDFTSNEGRFALKAVSGSSVNMVVTPKTTFVKLPQPGPDGKTWVSLTEAALADATASSNPAAVQSAQLLENVRSQIDPRATLDALGARVPDLHKIGSQRIRGTDTTHLRGNVDLSEKAIAAAPASKRAALRRAREAFGADGYPVDVWLDEDGRVRRVQYALESGTGADKASTTVRLDLYGFGDASGIVIPKASEVGDGSALLYPTTSTTVAPKK
jgi:hypothetical protein